MSDSDAVLGLEPDDLDGHTVEELNDYLDAGRTPPDASIDDSPACQIALGALQRLRELTSGYLDAAPASGDQDWIAGVLAVLPLEARAGRTFPLVLPDPDTSGDVTEGALRGLIRGTGDAVPGFLVGAVRIVPTEDDGSGAPVSADLHIEAALHYGTRLRDAETAFRAALEAAIARHVPFRVRAVDLRIVALIAPRTGEAR